MRQFYFLKKPNLVTVERYSDFIELIFETHGNLELLFGLSGKLEVANQNNLFTVESNQIHIIQKSTLYTIRRKTEKASVLRVVIDGLQISGYEKNQVLNSDIRTLNMQEQDADFILSNCLYLHKLFIEPMSIAKEEIYTSILSTILLFLIHKLNASEKESFDVSDITKKAKKYIEENFTQEITLTLLADRINFSVYYLAHIFKKETGISPMQYLMNCRMEKAKELLQLTDNTLFDIAQQVGYSNTNYFNMLFKRVVGNTPGKYRNKFRKTKS